jgi:hypothetical protein
MTLISNRDALAKTLAEHRIEWRTAGTWCNCGWGDVHQHHADHDAHLADALIASGAVVDAATLADDEELLNRFARTLALHERGNDRIFYGSTGRLMRRLAADVAAVLTERAS